MNGGLHAQPMMDAREVQALHAYLDEHRPQRVLEWGAGGSTLYWPAQYPDVRWSAIEHDPAYYRAVSAALPPNADLRLLPFPAYWRAEGTEGPFDLILVDGRERVRCLDTARRLLAPGGAVLLHDCGRRRYAPAEAYYRQSALLVPPKAGLDGRGLRLFRDPLPQVDRLAPLTGPRGAMYLVWGRPALEQARASILSLWRHLPDLPVLVLGDAAAGELADRGGVAVLQLDVDPFSGSGAFSFKAGRVKPLLAASSPFERTLYADADTEFKTSPLPGFDLLDRWDFVIAEAETRSLAQTFPDNRTEAGDTARRLGTADILYHNSGLFWWRRGEAASQLFRYWGEEWAKYQGWDEQVALLRALLNSDAVWLNVPYTWNCRGPQEAYLVYHRFASRAARRDGGGVTVLPNPRGQPMPPSRPLVRVEVEPGRYIRVHRGDEARAVEQFRQSVLMQARRKRQEVK